jgi:integrase
MARITSISFSRFEKRVVKQYKPPLRRKATLAKIAQVLREFRPHCRTTRDVDPDAIADWLRQHADRAPITNRSLLSAFRAACSYGVYKGWIRNPFEFRRLDDWFSADEIEPDDEEPFPHHRTAEEIQAILRLADREALAGAWKAARLRALVYTAAFTGAHKNEILGLRKCDVDLDASVIKIRSHAQKKLKNAARAARIPIAGPLLKVLKAWMRQTQRSEWLFPNAVDRPWLHGRHGYRALDQVKQLGERAGVEGLTLIAFRHTFATLAEDWGIGELMLQRLLRHSNRRSQRSYRHQDLELMARAIGKVDYRRARRRPGPASVCPHCGRRIDLAT